MNETLTKILFNRRAEPDDENLPRIGRSMARMRLMTGRRLIGRLAIQSAAPGLNFPISTCSTPCGGLSQSARSPSA